MAVVSHTKLQRIADLLGYQQRIIQTSYNRQPGCWAVYDCQFRLKASATSSADWSTIDLNLWHDAFPNQNMTQALPPLQSQPRPRYSTQRYASNQPRCTPSSQQRIFLDWNDDPNPDCPHPHCKYEHTCYRCTFNPRIVDKCHKSSSAQMKAKGFNTNPSSTNQGDNCELKLTAIIT